MGTGFRGRGVGFRVRIRTLGLILKPQTTEPKNSKPERRFQKPWYTCAIVVQTLNPKP